MTGKEHDMELVQPKRYTEEDYYKLPEEIRAELIDGQFYYMAPYATISDWERVPVKSIPHLLP